MLELLRLNPAQLLNRTDTRIVFAGGGNRCWWQGGMVEALRAHACWAPERFIGTSAGASIATAIVTGNLQASLRKAVAYFDSIPRTPNFETKRMGEQPGARDAFVDDVGRHRRLHQHLTLIAPHLPWIWRSTVSHPKGGHY